MYLIILSNGDTHKVLDDVAERIASTRMDSDFVFCPGFGQPLRWLNPEHIVSVVPIREKD